MHSTFLQDKFKDVDFIYDNIFFQIAAHKYPNKAFLIPNLFVHENLQLDKIEGADFKCGNSFFKIPVQQDKFGDFKYDNCIFKL